MPAVTYRTAVLRQMDYYQTEGISYTDTQWVFSPVTQMKTVYYLNVFVYRYPMGREGQTMDPKIMDKTMSQRLRCYTDLLKSIQGLKLSPSMVQFTTEQLAKHAFYIYEFYLINHPRLDRSSLRKFDAELKELNPSVYQRCDEFQYRLHIPYHHISDWRKRGIKRIPLLIRMTGSFLDIIGTIRIRYFMRSNPNERR